VLVLIGVRLGFPAAVAGVSTLLLLIPTQVGLAHYIGHLRGSTALQTDERVRRTNEAVSGILAAKMLSERRRRVEGGLCRSPARLAGRGLELGAAQRSAARAHLNSHPEGGRVSAGWEDPFIEQIQAVRKREAEFIYRSSWIRAANMALGFAITPLVCGQQAAGAERALSGGPPACQASPSSCSGTAAVLPICQTDTSRRAAGITHSVCRGARHQQRTSDGGQPVLRDRAALSAAPLHGGVFC
jgi:hypothetical protein